MQGYLISDEILFGANKVNLYSYSYIISLSYQYFADELSAQYLSVAIYKLWPIRLMTF